MMLAASTPRPSAEAPFGSPLHFCIFGSLFWVAHKLFQGLVPPGLAPELVRQSEGPADEQDQRKPFTNGPTLHHNVAPCYSIPSAGGIISDVTSWKGSDKSRYGTGDKASCHRRSFPHDSTSRNISHPTPSGPHAAPQVGHGVRLHRHRDTLPPLDHSAGGLLLRRTSGPLRHPHDLPRTPRNL